MLGYRGVNRVPHTAEVDIDCVAEGLFMIRIRCPHRRDAGVG